MRESDILHENGFFWVGRDRQSKAYVVFTPRGTYSAADSGYPMDPAGLSLAIARCDYLAKRAAAKDAPNA